MKRMLQGSALAGAVVALFAMGTGGAFAAQGNSGDVKINGTTVDQIPNNAPHQGCAFTMEYYNFAVGSPDATYAFTLQAPTQVGNNMLASGSVAIGGGELPGYPMLDAAVTVDLSTSLAASGAVPAQQGYHVRMDVTSPDQQGNGSKSKVFWVDGSCGGGGPQPG